MKRIATLLSLVLTMLGSACAETNINNADVLKKAVHEAAVGETIYVAEGRYDIADLKIPRDLTIIGERGVIFYSSRPVEKGILNPLWDASLHIENIKFEGARSPDLNGAGIRHDGEHLTVINCIFENNENGILATGQAHGEIEITNSQFVRNGQGDGYSHSIYLSSGASLEIQNTAFIGTKIGHHVKSLAERTSISNSSFDDADGKTSYAVDTSRGGAVSITNSSFLQAEDADNSTLFNYDLTRGGVAVSLEITGNRIVNRNRKGRLLRNDSALTPIISNNEIINEGRGRMIAQ